MPCMTLFDLPAMPWSMCINGHSSFHARSLKAALRVCAHSIGQENKELTAKPSDIGRTLCALRRRAGLWAGDEHVP